MPEKQDIAGVVVRDERGRYLMVQEKRIDVRGKWNLPAGRVDPGETPEAAAVREAREETGYEVEIVGKPIFEGFIEPADRAFHIYAARIIGGERTINPNEVLDVAWLSYEEITSLHAKGLVRAEHFFDIITTFGQHTRAE